MSPAAETSAVACCDRVKKPPARGKAIDANPPIAAIIDPFLIHRKGTDLGKYTRGSGAALEGKPHADAQR